MKDEKTTTENLIETARAFLANAGLNEKKISELEGLGYFDAPAAMKHHLNRPHGLCEHSINVTRLLLEYGIFRDRMSAYRVGMLHDLVKMYNYKPVNHDDGRTTYTFRNAPYPGHGVASALIAADLCIYLTDEERSAIIWHMGAFKMTDDEMDQYRTASMRHAKAVLGTHFCDHLASVREELDDLLNKRKSNDKN